MLGKNCTRWELQNFTSVLQAATTASRWDGFGSLTYKDFEDLSDVWVVDQIYGVQSVALYAQEKGQKRQPECIYEPWFEIEQQNQNLNVLVINHGS